jgi:hypothetical protein
MGASEFDAALRAMNEAAHDFDVDSEAAQRAIDVGSRFLNELKRTGIG